MYYHLIINMEKLCELGIRFGLEGEALREFGLTQQNIEREERLPAREREKEEKEKEREEREREREREKKEKERNKENMTSK